MTGGRSDLKKGVSGTLKCYFLIKENKFYGGRGSPSTIFGLYGFFLSLIGLT